MDKSKGQKIVFSLRIDELIYERVKRLAQHEKRSINAQIESYIENGIAKDTKGKDGANPLALPIAR